ncbi:MAG: MMPL family transporter, partial [Clostridiales bacterium]|nr:MMPL family transporter [Clostridiales bacterium]
RSGFISDVDGTEYTYYTVSVAGAAESGEAVETVEDIESIIHNAFGDDAPYRAAGSTQTVRDLAEATKKDFVVVSIVSAVLILIILVITFRTLLLPLLMVAVIELAILLNMSISALSGSSINFMTYVVISAIQLGATIDYAILLVKNYRLALPASESPAEAVAQAIKNSAFSILISMFILSGACLSVYFVSSDKIIREITMMIARGAAISAVLVLFILPALLSLKKNKRLGI